MAHAAYDFTSRKTWLVCWPQVISIVLSKKSPRDDKHKNRLGS